MFLKELVIAPCMSAMLKGSYGTDLILTPHCVFRTVDN